ncbi:cell wall-active antibiotics response protein LiaF [Alkalihalobacillus pseudalcaliphilus]|uniref:cell wall-active antibiotics response protein LiaF n=1 Tax=Alkalihalobacillus pseudalcaliphilus TaxID=79884 RepID=UPI00069DCF81|nr:cell wall-active antibiotics response protein LiaF [Alkalihalobacillus pseudalcaliphilus]
MSKKSLFGLIIIIIGAIMLLNIFFAFTGSLLAPLLFIVIGYYFYQKGHRFLSSLFFILSGILIFDEFFDLNFLALLFAGLFIYYGWQLLNGAPKHKQNKSKRKRSKTRQENPYQTTYTSERDKEKSSKDDVEATWYDELDEDLAALEDEIESLTDELDFYEEQIEESPWGDEDTERDKRRNVRRKRMAHEENHFNHKDETFRQNDTSDRNHFQSSYDPIIKRHILGDIRYKRREFELKDMTIWNGIGDVKVDLSRAIIPEGEHIIIIQVIVGQIDIYIPEDLQVAIQAYSLIGDVAIFHEKHSGFNKQIHVADPSYKQSPRRVKLILNTLIGEVRVRSI